MNERTVLDQGVEYQWAMVIGTETFSQEHWGTFTPPKAGITVADAMEIVRQLNAKKVGAQPAFVKVLKFSLVGP